MRQCLCAVPAPPSSHTSSQTVKVRVVFDCAAKSKGVCLNDVLKQGLNPTSSLVGVLPRFCKESMVFFSNIESMFHQVELDPEGTTTLSFLWWCEDNIDDEPTEYNINVQVFGAPHLQLVSPLICLTLQESLSICTKLLHLTSTNITFMLISVYSYRNLKPRPQMQFMI